MEKPKSLNSSRANVEMKRKRDHHCQIQILGQAPADLRKQISAIHALAVLQRSQQATTPKRLLGQSAAAGDTPAFGPSKLHSIWRRPQARPVQPQPEVCNVPHFTRISGIPGAVIQRSRLCQMASQMVRYCWRTRYPQV